MIYWLLEIVVVNKKYLPGIFYSRLFKTIILFIICIYNLNIDELQFNHTGYKKNKSNFIFQNRTHTQLYKKLDKVLPGNNYVLFNTPQYDNISIMFYSNVTAYNFPITYEIYKDLKKRNIKMATFDYDSLPDFIKNDHDIFIIN